jgi:hypothetical protein
MSIVNLCGFSLIHLSKKLYLYLYKNIQQQNYEESCTPDFVGSFKFKDKN